MNAGLLVDGSDDSALLVLDGVEGSQEVQLQATGNLVLELNLSSENVRGGPSLGDGNTVLGVNPLALNVTSDCCRLGVTETGDLEGSRERGGLDLERSTVDGVVLGEQVRGGLAEVFPGGGNGGRHYWREQKRTTTKGVL